MGFLPQACTPTINAATASTNATTAMTKALMRMALSSESSLSSLYTTVLGVAPSGYAPDAGKAVLLFNTRFAMMLKLGLPRPVTASHPGEAAKYCSQQGAVSMDEPTPQA